MNRQSMGGDGKRRRREEQYFLRNVLKRLPMYLWLFLSVPLFAQSQTALPFGKGEHIEYSVWFNFIRGGQHTLDIASIDTLDGNPCFHIISRTKSKGVFEKIYRVRDTSETWLDTEGLFSRRFRKAINEGRYHKKYDVRFDYSDSLAYSKRDTVRIDRPVQDALSIFYAARAERLWVGRDLHLNNFDQDTLIDYNLKVNGRETVDSALKQHECFVLEPYKEKGELFRNKGKITIYLSDDENRIPVMIVGKATIGSMIFKLEDYRKAHAGQR